jgi:hypothetical protein
MNPPLWAIGEAVAIAGGLAAQVARIPRKERAESALAARSTGTRRDRGQKRAAVASGVMNALRRRAMRIRLLQTRGDDPERDADDLWNGVPLQRCLRRRLPSDAVIATPRGGQNKLSSTRARRLQPRAIGGHDRVSPRPAVLLRWFVEEWRLVQALGTDSARARRRAQGMRKPF